MGLPRALRLVLATSVALIVAVGIAGCEGATTMPVPTYTPTGTSTATSAPTKAPVDAPVLRPGGSAAANQQFFDFTNQAFYAAHGMSDGTSIIDNLVAAGFVKTDMELTPDSTTAGVAADSIIFSVRVNSECLIGQFSAAGYKGVEAKLLGTGGCLIGTTRPIDW